MCSTLMCCSFICSWRALTASAGPASHFVQIGKPTATALILAGVDGWAVVIVAPRRAVAIAVDRTLVIGTEHVVAQMVVSLRSTKTDYYVPATKISFIMKGIRERRPSKKRGTAQ